MDIKKRIKSFNQTFTIQDIRTKRIESNIHLRKIKRCEHNVDKRPLLCKGGMSRSECIYNISLLSPSLYNTFPKLFHSSASFPMFLDEILNCENLSLLLPLIISLRKFLSQDCRPVQETISSGVVKKLIPLIGIPNFSKEIVWCMINLTSEAKVKDFINLGLLEELIKQLNSDDLDLIDSCVWCISNIAGDSVEARNIVLETGVLSKLVKLLKVKYCVKNCVWCISNLCKGKPKPGEVVSSIVLQNIPVLLDDEDEAVISSACEAIYRATDDFFHEESPVWLEKIIKYLNDARYSIYFNCLKIIGNIVLNSDSIIKKLLDLRILDTLEHFLTSKQRDVKKEALLLYSNICAGPSSNLDEVLSHKTFDIVVEYLDSEDLDIKTEAIFILRNVSEYQGATDYFIAQGVIQRLINVLDLQNPHILMPVLGILNDLLRTPEIKNHFDQAGGIDSLEKLQKQPNSMIYFNVVSILDKYYGIEEV